MQGSAVKRFSSVKDAVADKNSQANVTVTAKAGDVTTGPETAKQIVKQIVKEPAVAENAVQKTDVTKEVTKEVKKDTKEKIENGEKKTLEMVEYEESVNSKRFKLNKPLLAFSTMLSPSVSSGSMELLSRANTGHKDMFSSMDREQIPYENLYDTKYLPPVSVGFQVVLPVDKRVSFGTGINYTLLYSYTDVQNRNGSERQEQTVHYIGIPFNLYINILESKGFRLYANTGVMLEKGSCFEIQGYRRYSGKQYSERVGSTVVGWGRYRRRIHGTQKTWAICRSFSVVFLPGRSACNSKNCSAFAI